MKVLGGVLIGSFASGVALPVIGFVLGGLGRAAPCHSAPDFMSGAIFGVFAITYVLFVPACIAGAVVGGIVGAVLEARHRLGTAGEVTDLRELAALQLKRCIFGDITHFHRARGHLWSRQIHRAPLERLVCVGQDRYVSRILLIHWRRSDDAIPSKAVGHLLGPLIGVFFYMAIAFAIVHQATC